MSQLTPGSSSRAPTRPEVMIFDVNETLSDLSVLGQRPPTSARPRSSPRPGSPHCCGTASLWRPPPHVKSGLRSLDVQPDVPQGTAALAAQGLRLVTLSNESVDTAVDLLGRAGARDRFERLLSFEQAGTWTRTCRLRLRPAAVPGAGLATAWLNRTGAP